MKKFRYGLFFGIFVVIFSLVIGWWIDRPETRVYHNQPVIVENIQMEDGEWSYQLYTGSYFRLEVLSDTPLGYSRGDTVQFAGSNHPCEKVKRKRQIHNSSFEPIMEKPE